MGIPIPLPPTPPGAPDCLTCTPDPWPSGATPAVIRIVARGMGDWPGDPPQPNNVPVHCVQAAGDPCYWSGTLYFGPGTYDYVYYSVTSELYINRTAPNSRIIFDAYDSPCFIGPFANTANQPDLTPVGGTANCLDFPLSIILLLAYDYNLLPDARGLYDVVDSVTPDHKCVRLAGRTYPGSVLIDVDVGAI